MRHILTSVVLLVLLFPALAVGEEVTMDDLVERDGLTVDNNINLYLTRAKPDTEVGKGI